MADIDTDSVIIELDQIVLTQAPLVQNLMSISAGLQTFLLNLIAATIEHGVDAGSVFHLGLKPEPDSTNENKLVTRKRLQDFILKAKGPDATRGASDALVSKRLGELAALNVAVSKVYTGVSGKEKYYHYRVTDLIRLASLPPVRKHVKIKKGRRTKTQVMLQKEFFLKDEKAIFLQGHKELSVHIHQRIFNGILDSAMRLSHKDQRQEIEVSYTVMGKPLIIRATCSTGADSGISTLTDQRAMRPIIAYCKKEIARRKAQLIAQHGENFMPSMVPNIFKLDIYDLCMLMGMKPLSENINQAVAMMRRLADTSFRVDARKNQWFKENFSMMPGSDGVISDIFEFRFLSNLEIAEDHGAMADLFNAPPEELRPRFYTFSLEIRLFYSLVLDDSSTIFISHQDLSSEQSGIIQRLYNWARFWVSGRERPNVSQKWYSLVEMHEKLTPAARLDNFRIYFLRALSKKAIGEFQLGVGGKSLVYGYYVYYQYKDGTDYFRFERDRNDPIVGDNSKHAVLLRQSVLDDLSETVID